MPGWETGSPSRTKFLDFSGIPSLDLSLGTGTECLHSSWVKATVILLKGVGPCGPAVRRPATIPSSPVLSRIGVVSREGGSPSSSIWVSPRATALQQFSGRQRGFTAAPAPLSRPAPTAGLFSPSLSPPSPDLSLRCWALGAPIGPIQAGSFNVSLATARPRLGNPRRN